MTGGLAHSVRARFTRIPALGGAVAAVLVMAVSIAPGMPRARADEPSRAPRAPAITSMPGAARAPASTSATAPAGRTAAVIVRAAPGGIPLAAARVRAAGGHLTRDLPIIDGFAARVPSAALPALQADPSVRAIAPDATVRLASRPAGEATTAVGSEPTSAYRQALRTDQVWQAGDQGQGVTVALIDTGVSAGTDLSGRMVSVQTGLLGQTAPCKNLSGEPTCNDTYGHGTFVAGIIAGSGAASGGTYAGVAPQAKLLSVKVAGADGSTDVSNVLAAIQWVVSFKSQYGIKVLNLSLATDSSQTYRTDPFDYAVERAWDAGIVVIASAGNTGPGAATVTKPGDDPLVITVGAVDDRGTPGIGDDELPDFSARGPTAADGLSKPDVVAPGAHLVSLRSVGSTIDQAFTDYIDGAYHRGSGTSFSAAAVSGVTALILSRTPGLSPNQVKYALTSSARQLAATTDPQQVGAGEVDAATAALNPPAGSANGGVIRSNGTGLLEASRGNVRVQTTTLPATVVDGALTAQLVLWDPLGLLLGWNPTSWYLSTWALFPWLPVTWSNVLQWPGYRWGGGNWQGSTWQTSTQPRSYGTPIVGAIWFGAWG